MPWIEKPNHLTGLGILCAGAHTLRVVARRAAEGEVREVVASTAFQRDDVINLINDSTAYLRCATILAPAMGAAFNLRPLGGTDDPACHEACLRRKRGVALYGDYWSGGDPSLILFVAEAVVPRVSRDQALRLFD